MMWFNRFGHLRLRLLGALVLGAAASLGATALAAKQPVVARVPAGGWLSHVAVTAAGSHVLGNPDAPVKLTEYMSYTCPHCAVFENEAAAQLRFSFIAHGKGSLEIRHFLRDPIDMAVALLTNCGPPRHFFVLHQAFLHGQGDWLAAANGLTQAQQARWANGPFPARMRAIAGDLNFYEIMENHGIDRMASDRCLSDAAMMQRLSALTVEASKAGVDGTPSFAINGVLLTGTHGWAALQPQLAARVAP